MKVAVNGAGIAGGCLACWLERTGHDVVLIEKAPQFRTGGYAVDFWGVGYTVAERMGILPEVRAHGYTFREVRDVDQRGRKVGGFSTDLLRQSLMDRFASVPRGDLAAAMYRAIGRGVETLFDNSISAISERASCVLVSFEHGPARQFDLVIGADGLHYTVRALVFGPERQFEKPLGYRVATFEVEGYRPRDELIGVTYTTPGRRVGRFALRGDRTMFAFIFCGEKLTGPEPSNATERKAVLHQVFADAGWECPQILQAMNQIDDMYYDRPELAIPSAVGAPLEQELPLAVVHLHAVVGLIGDIDTSAPHCDAPGVVELTVSGTGPAPLPKELALPVIDGDPVGFLLLRGTHRREVADVNIAVLVGGDASGVGKHVERVPELSPGVEALHPGVVEVRDKHLVVRSDGYSDREVELARPGTVSAPLQQETRRRAL
jgi:hypothetical protein